MKIFNPEEKLKDSILNDTEKKEYHQEFIENKSVFGIDIYKYSEYPEDIQVYVPVLFNAIYSLTVKMCLNAEKYFFINYGKNVTEFKSNFISTGDGGFQIFENPIQSIVFGAYFELNVRRFNSGSYIGNLNKNLFEIIDRIELRYSVTYDKVYSYDKNFFGPGIINNARILSKDSLNRLLIDQNTLRWFDKHLNTIENLMQIRLSDLSKLEYFKDCDDELTSLIFRDEDEHVVKSVDILKIGSIKSKNTNLDIYNLKLQFSMYFDKERGKFKKDYEHFTYSIGNLNTQGIF